MTPAELDAIRARVSLLKQKGAAFVGTLTIVESFDELLAFVDELRGELAGVKKAAELLAADVLALKAAAGKVRCQQCGAGDGAYTAWVPDVGWRTLPCPYCADLRALLDDRSADRNPRAPARNHRA